MKKNRIYIAILGLICLFMLVAPSMAVTSACSACTPDSVPKIGTSCPKACIIELGENFFTVISQIKITALDNVSAPFPSPSPLSGYTPGDSFDGYGPGSTGGNNGNSGNNGNNGNSGNNDGGYGYHCDVNGYCDTCIPSPNDPC